MARSSTARLLAATAGKARAFTLMEMMVGVGAVAIVAVGLAAIFRSVGDTVSGGRRVSVLNTYAALIESQMRRDFENMSRDGFLIIRHQWTDLNGSGELELPGDDIPIAPDAPPRPARRIDELQFVVNGEFRSARKPLLPGVEPKSNTAIVYYGHGQVAPLPAVPALGTAPDRLNYKKPVPAADDAVAVLAAPLGAPSAAVGQDNPNQYPIDWTLLRQQTVLVSPESAKALPVDEATVAFGFDASTPPGYEFLRNRPTQFFLQPAASSLFRSIADIWPNIGQPGTPDRTLRFETGIYSTENYYPARASGVVDIATGSLAEVRARVSSMGVWPGQVGLAAGQPTRPLLSIAPRAGAPLAQRPTSPQPVDLAHAWLNETMPTDSRNFEASVARNEPPAFTVDSVGTRIRYEPGPTDLLASFSNPGTAYETAVRHADQLMLSSSNFVPHCTGFRVDWSFGMTTANGEVVWHGLPSRGVVMAGQPLDIMPYPFGPGGTYDLDLVISRPATGTPITHTVTDRLIHGVRPTVTTSEMTSYFGWIDPTYVPSGGSVVPVADSPTSQVVPWAWPRMVRVTVTLADPLQPSDERSFQYIFAVPEAQGPRAQ